METNRAQDWLAGCEGFRVETPNRRLGNVVEIRRDPESRQPKRLVVHAGLFGLQRLDVPVDDIAGIVVSEEVIVLDRAPTEDAAVLPSVR
jgi:hypothetical protein